MDLVNYTKQFSHEYNFIKREAHNTMEPKIKELEYKKLGRLYRAQAHELGGPISKLIARHNYRKADRLQHKIDRGKDYLNRIDSLEQS